MHYVRTQGKLSILYQYANLYARHIEGIRNLWPAELVEVFAAGFLCRKTRLELRQIAGVIFDHLFDFALAS